MNLAQLIGTSHKICSGQGQTSDTPLIHLKDKILATRLFDIKNVVSIIRFLMK
jgi:hypothetical protein